MKKILLFILFSLFFAKGASALTISPPVIDVEVNPGEVKEQIITLYNEGTEAMLFSGYLEAFTPKGEAGEAQLVSGNSYGALDWVSFGTNNFTLAPGEMKEVPIVINVPSTSQVGGYYVAAMWTAYANGSGESKEAMKKTTIVARVGSLVLIKVKGSVTEKLEILEFNADGNNYRSSLPVNFTARLKNSGNVHIKPAGYVTVVNMFGRVADNIPFNGEDRNVLPSSTRKFNVVWQKNADTVPAGLLHGITVELKNFALGKYSAQLSMEYGDDHNRLSSQAVTFWIIPWRILTGLGVCILLYCCIVILLRKRRGKKLLN